LLHELVPPTVVVQSNGDVVLIHGRTGDYLDPAVGMPTSANVLNMAKDGLEAAVAGVLQRAGSTSGEVGHRGARVRASGELVQVDVRARRLAAPDALQGLVVISFERARDAEAPSVDLGRVAALELALDQLTERHGRTIHELEVANEELTAKNEELRSAN